MDNPNAVALVLDGIGYRLRLNDQPLLDGRRDEETTIAANGRSVIELPVTVRYEDLYRVIRSFEVSGDPITPSTRISGSPSPSWARSRCR